MIIPLIQGLLAVATGFVTYIMTGGAMKILLLLAGWVAFKLLAKLVLFTVVPILLYNIFTDYALDMMQWGLDYIGASGFSPDSLVVQLTGIAGYIATTIGLPSMLAMYMSAISVRFILNVMRL